MIYLNYYCNSARIPYFPTPATALYRPHVQRILTIADRLDKRTLSRKTQVDRSVFVQKRMEVISKTLSLHVR